MVRVVVRCVAAALMALAMPTAAHGLVVGTAESTAPSWLTDTAALAVAAHAEKVPADFGARLAHIGADGRMRVIVNAADRSPATRALVAAATADTHWYGSASRFTATVTPAGLTALLEADAIRFVSPDHPLDYLLARSASDIRARGPMWNLTGSGLGTLAAAPDVELDADVATGKGVTVAVVDSGIDGTHQDFSGWGCTPGPYAPCDSRIKEQVSTKHLLDVSMDGGETYVVDDAGLDGDNDLASGHGTHVAGIIGGNGYYARNGAKDAAVFGGDGVPMGVAPQADLINIKNGDVISAAFGQEGLEWVLANHAKYGIRVVNNSWGCLTGCTIAPNDPHFAVIEELYKAGVLVVFAAGNGGGTESGSGFSGYSQSPFSLSVASYNAANRVLASSSSRGSSAAKSPSPATWTPEAEKADAAKQTPAAIGYRRPDVAAPGESVWSARSLTASAGVNQPGAPRVGTDDALGGGTTGIRPYALASGTSMSAPHVSAAGALLFSACPAAKPLDVMRAVMATADAQRVRQAAGGPAARPFEVGYGGLDVRAALDWMRANVTACRTVNVDPTAAVTGTQDLVAGGTATFDGSGSADADGRIVAHGWDFGDGSTATGAQVEHTYARSGAYVVRLTVTDDRGATAVATWPVTVRNAAPVAAFSGPDRVTATEPAAFDGSASTDEGSIAAYAWDFGDGTTATGVQVDHAFPRSGTYVVTLTVTDDEGASVSHSRTVEVDNALPTAGFSAPSTLAHMTAGTFDAADSADRDGSLTAYAWSFGDGGEGAGRSVEHAYTWAGEYVVRLTVTDDDGASATTTRTVSVTDVPATGQKRINASGLTKHKCDASAWTFTLSDAAAAPSRIAVVWADGSRERVAGTIGRKTAVYRTTASLDQIATKAWADVPSASAATLSLTSGPCQ